MTFKHLILTLLLLTLGTKASYSQSISIDKLLELRTSSLDNLEEYLTGNNWDFYTSLAETDTSFSVATFSYNRSSFGSDKADMWLNYISDSKIGLKRITCQYHSSLKQSKFIARTKVLGYKLIQSKVNDDELMKVYQKGLSVILSKSISKKDDESESTSTYYILTILSLPDYKIYYLKNN